MSNKLALAGAFELENESREVSDDLIEGFNGATILSATRQVYARDLHFRYAFKKEEGSRKASRLIDDRLFRRQNPAEQSTPPVEEISPEGQQETSGR